MTITLRGAAVTIAFAASAALSACGSDSGGGTTIPIGQSGLTLSLSSGTLSVAQGSNKTLTAGIIRTGTFAGAVTITVTGLPSGVTASPNPAAIPSGGVEATIVFAASASAPPGTTTVTIRASGAGVTDQTATVALTVNGPTAGTANTTYTFCGAAILFAAYQDGTGAWAKATVNGNAISFNLASGRGGMAIVYPVGSTAFGTFIYYGSQAELNTGAFACTALGTNSVSGTVAGLASADYSFVGMGGGIGTATGVAPNFVVPNVLAGSRDVLAGRLVATTNPVSLFANKVIIRRGVAVTSSTTLGTLDFNSAEAVATVPRTWTASNIGTDVVNESNMTYQTSTLSFTTLYSQSTFTGTSAQFPTVANPAAGDLHVLEVSVTPNPRPITTSRNTFTAFHTGTDQTVTFGPPIGAVTVTTAATSPGARLRFQYTLQPEYKRVYYLHSGVTNGSVRSIAVYFFPGYLAGLASIDHVEPDFSALAGWNTAWGQPAGVETQWSFVVQNYTRDASLSQDGDFLKNATRLGTITP